MGIPVKRLERLALPLVAFVVLVAAWQVVSWLGVFPPTLLPPPVAVAGGVWELWRQGVLLEHIGTSLYRFAAGYSLAVALGIPLGLITGWYWRLEVALDPFIQVFRPISPIAWIPLATLWFGIGDRPAIFIIFLASFFPVFLSSVAAVKNVDPLLLRVARNFGATEGQLLLKVVLPAVFPYIAVGLHMALGAAWIFLVAGEMIGLRSGLGYLIVDGRNQVRYDLVLASMLLIGTLGWAIDRAMRLAESRVIRRWGGARH